MHINLLNKKFLDKSYKRYASGRFKYYGSGHDTTSRLVNGSIRSTLYKDVPRHLIYKNLTCFDEVDNAYACSIYKSEEKKK